MWCFKLYKPMDCFNKMIPINLYTEAWAWPVGDRQTSVRTSRWWCWRSHLCGPGSPPGPNSHKLESTTLPWVCVSLLGSDPYITASMTPVSCDCTSGWVREDLAPVGHLHKCSGYICSAQLELVNGAAAKASGLSVRATRTTELLRSVLLWRWCPCIMMKEWL